MELGKIAKVIIKVGSKTVPAIGRVVASDQVSSVIGCLEAGSTGVPSRTEAKAAGAEAEAREAQGDTAEALFFIRVNTKCCTLVEETTGKDRVHSAGICLATWFSQLPTVESSESELSLQTMDGK